MTKQSFREVLFCIGLNHMKKTDVQLPYFDWQKHQFHMVQQNTSVIKYVERTEAL